MRPGGITIKIGIVGAGFGGISAAALLARDGQEVTVLEKNEGPGGRASVYSQDGFTFDMGPSWYLMPDVFERFLAEFRKKPEDLFELKRLDPSYRMFFEEGDVVDISSDMERNYRTFDALELGGGSKLKHYLESSKQKYDTVIDELLYRDYQSLFDFFDRRLLKEGRDMNILQNLDEFVNRTFESDYARKIVEYSIGFLGGSPRVTPAFYHIMSHIDFNLGVWYPIGGMRKVVNSMVELAESHGAEFQYDREVTAINVENKVARSVQTNQGPMRADAFLVNADYAYTEMHLLDRHSQSYSESYWEGRMLAPSALVAYVGLDYQPEELVHHNLFIQKDWMKGFDELFDPMRARWPSSPSYYVNVPSRTDPTAAPKGCDTLFILVPVAAGLEDSERSREAMYERVIDHLENTVGVKVRGHEQVKRLFTHRDFISRYNAYKGTALGLVHTLRQTALFRPSHQSKKVKNLFYSGQYCHPGIGVPMTLISSQIVTGQMLKGSKS